MVASHVPDLGGLAERLAAAVHQAGGRSVVSEASGVPKTTLDRYLRAQSEAPALTLARIAAVCGVSVAWLLGDDSAAPTTWEMPPPPARDRPLRSAGADAASSEGFVALPWLDLRASGGAGGPSGSGDEPLFLFSRPMLDQLGVAPENAELARVEGDSMFPTLQDGDMILIDRGFGDVVHGKIYVLSVEGLAVVKRVNILAIGGMTLISDNDRYPSETVRRKDLGTLTFQGRVAWFGRAF